MSIDIDWPALTEGPHGHALAETIRGFIHDRFQHVTFPRLIQSVKVTSFDFGSVAPELELKDVCDPLPDFYDDEDDEDNASPMNQSRQLREGQSSPRRNTNAVGRVAGGITDMSVDTHSAQHHPVSGANGASSPLISRVATPGIPGGTSNLNYFHMPLGVGLSGTTTPLAAISGAQLSHGWSSGTALNYMDPHGFPSSARGSISGENPGNNASKDTVQPVLPTVEEEPNANDVQIVFRLRYSGDIKLSLAAEILLDFPMPSFVGLPVNLHVTGLTFDGVAILAYIKRKAHFCFLAPEDAEALVGGAADAQNSDEGRDQNNDASSEDRKPVGGLFEDIRVESEIGEKHDSKQVLKNVGTVEKFVLEQVTKIFETELVYPSFWTFLV